MSKGKEHNPSKRGQLKRVMQQPGNKATVCPGTNAIFDISPAVARRQRRIHPLQQSRPPRSLQFHEIASREPRLDPSKIPSLPSLVPSWVKVGVFGTHLQRRRVTSCRFITAQWWPGRRGLLRWWLLSIVFWGMWIYCEAEEKQRNRQTKKKKTKAEQTTGFPDPACGLQGNHELGSPERDQSAPS